MNPPQGSLELLTDETAQRILTSTEMAHLAYTWTDGTPRCTPIWFHWNGSEIVMSRPYTVLLVRGRAAVDEIAGVAPEYREAAVRYFGEAQGNGWCDQLPADMRMFRVRVAPEWVGLLDFDGLRRLPSALAG